LSSNAIGITGRDKWSILLKVNKELEMNNHVINAEYRWEQIYKEKGDKTSSH